MKRSFRQTFPGSWLLTRVASASECERFPPGRLAEAGFFVFFFFLGFGVRVLNTLPGLHEQWQLSPWGRLSIAISPWLGTGPLGGTHRSIGVYRWVIHNKTLVLSLAVLGSEKASHQPTASGIPGRIPGPWNFGANRANQGSGTATL